MEPVAETVIAYVPTGVPFGFTGVGVGVKLLPPPPPPQPAIRITASTEKASDHLSLLRLLSRKKSKHMINKPRAAMTAGGGPNRHPEFDGKKAVDRVVVVIVKVTGIPTSEAVGGLKPHAAPAGSPLQVNVAAPAVD